MFLTIFKKNRQYFIDILYKTNYLEKKWAICKPWHWNLGIGIGIGTDISNAIISSSIRSMDTKFSRVVN